MIRAVRRHSRFAARVRAEDGMTMIEVMAAMGILTVGILAVASTIVASLLTLRVSRDRQDATQLASSNLETIRSLGWEAVAHDPAHPTTPSGPNAPNGEPYIFANAGQVLHERVAGKFTIETTVTWKVVNDERRILTEVSWSDRGTVRSVVEETVLAEARRGLPAPAFEINPPNLAVLKPAADPFECAEHDLVNLGEQDKYDANMTNGAPLTRTDVDYDLDGTNDTVQGFFSQGWFGWVEIDGEPMFEQTGDFLPDSAAFTGRNEVAVLEICYATNGTPASSPSFNWLFRSAFDPAITDTVTNTLTVVTGNTRLFLHHPVRNNGSFDTNADPPFFMSTAPPTSTAVTENYDKNNVDTRPGRRVPVGTQIPWDYQFTQVKSIGNSVRLLLYVNTGRGLDGTLVGSENFTYAVELRKVNTGLGSNVPLPHPPVTGTYTQTGSAWGLLDLTIDTSGLDSTQRRFLINEYLRVSFRCTGGANCHVHYDVTGANAKESQLQLVLT